MLDLVVDHALVVGQTDEDAGAQLQNWCQVDY